MEIDAVFNDIQKQWKERELLSQQRAQCNGVNVTKNVIRTMAYGEQNPKEIWRSGNNLRVWVVAWCSLQIGHILLVRSLDKYQHVYSYGRWKENKIAEVSLRV
jgi:hypothetical protein